MSNIRTDAELRTFDGTFSLVSFLLQLGKNCYLFSFMLNISDSLHVCISGPSEIGINIGIAQE